MSCITRAIPALCACVAASWAVAEPPVVDWVRATGTAAWRPRDSSGEVVFHDRLWLLGGWFDSYQPPPRDVWTSADGAAWELVSREAPWRFSDLPMTLVFRDRMWLLGGWTNGRLAGHGATSEVWSSVDGRAWSLETPRAEWSPRCAAGAVVFKDRMWILGGTENYYFGDQSSLKNDVWSSADGKTWRRETAAAPWSPRGYLQAAVHDGRIWVIAGGNYVPAYHATNDVWSSPDGVTWTLATDAPPFAPRLWHSVVAYRDHLWVLGGWSNNPSRNWGDVWYSKDGRDWRQLASKVCWSERHEHSAYVFRDRIWVAGGMHPPLTNDVWWLELPEDFFDR